MPSLSSLNHDAEQFHPWSVVYFGPFAFELCRFLSVLYADRDMNAIFLSKRCCSKGILTQTPIGLVHPEFAGNHELNVQTLRSDGIHKIAESAQESGKTTAANGYWENQLTACWSGTIVNPQLKTEKFLSEAGFVLASYFFCLKLWTSIRQVALENSAGRKEHRERR